MNKSIMLAFIIMLMYVLTPSVKADPQSINCLAKVVYHEARGEPVEGQKAVAHVILNRVKSPEFPKTVCRVIYQANQFENIRNTVPNIKSRAWHAALDIAETVLANMSQDPTKGAKYFYAQNKVSPSWAKKGTKSTVIGNHTFVNI